MTNRWYIVQAYSAAEKSVANAIKQRAEKAGLADLVKEVLVPTKKVPQIKKSKKIEVEKNFYPGYILLNADLTNDLWILIKEIPKVSGFVSQRGKPSALKQSEVDAIIGQIEDDSVSFAGDIEFELGESVRVIGGGPFDNFTGVIESVDNDKKNMVVHVTIFGRSTPVNLNFDQVEKI